jgi:cobalt-zinc-cadmium efflux system outer membrane protein
MRRSVEAAAADSADAAQRLHEAGNITDLQLAEREMLHEQARLDLASAELMVLDRREELSALMGVWGRDTGFTVATRLPELPQGEISLLGLESLAVSQRADLAAARHEIESIAESLGIDKVTGVVPQLALVGHYERELEGPGTAGPSLELTLPIFDQGQAKIAAASARLRQSEQRYAALAIQIRSDVRRLRNRLLSARSRTEYLAKVILPLRQRVVEQTQLEYNAMLVNVFQLLQSKQAEIETGREYIEALRDYWVARAELERSVGGRFAAPDEPSTNAGGQS